MSDEDALTIVFDKWRELTEAEGNAIQNSNWKEVDRLQNVKLELQKEIVRISGRFEENAERNHDTPTDLKEKFKPVVEELVVLEMRNSKWLFEKKADAQAEFDGLGRVSRNLQNVQKAYSNERQAVWNSYS
ncbi:MAG: hypothetical protein K9N48_01310 [Verrucomicrobia bacterium]|nr:hypothetical protein [Verrucomicrobiota bacterium]MCF7707290.1 hypothetical protein [Verrucomicrobiota bacterium]